jgi:hypothetical protein
LSSKHVPLAAAVAFVVVGVVAALVLGGGHRAPEAIRPKGTTKITTDEKPIVSVLVARDRIVIATTGISGDAAKRVIARAGHAPAEVWSEFEADLRQLHAAYFADRTDLELSGASDSDARVAYQDLVTAMDRSISAGFSDVALTDPASLSAH